MTEQDPGRILAEDVRATAVEAWLLDDGRFLVPSLVHPEIWGDGRFRRLMRQRRVLRMFLPPHELDGLPRLETTLRAGKRVHEIVDAFRRYEDWAEAPFPAPESAQAHLQAGRDTLLAAARGAYGHIRVIRRACPERSSPIRTVPYQPPPRVEADEVLPKPGKGGGKPARA